MKIGAIDWRLKLFHSETNSNQVGIGLSFEDLDFGDHLCCIYETEEEHSVLISSFLRRKLDLNQRIIYIIDIHTTDGILDYLKQDGLDSQPYLDNGQLIFLTHQESTPRMANFSQRKQLNYCGKQPNKL